MRSVRPRPTDLHSPAHLVQWRERTNPAGAVKQLVRYATDSTYVGFASALSRLVVFVALTMSVRRLAPHRYADFILAQQIAFSVLAVITAPITIAATKLASIDRTYWLSALALSTVWAAGWTGVYALLIMPARRIVPSFASVPLETSALLLLINSVRAGLYGIVLHKGFRPIAGAAAVSTCVTFGLLYSLLHVERAANPDIWLLTLAVYPLTECLVFCWTIAADLRGTPKVISFRKLPVGSETIVPAMISGSVLQLAFVWLMTKASLLPDPFETIALGWGAQLRAPVVMAASSVGLVVMTYVYRKDPIVTHPRMLALVGFGMAGLTVTTLLAAALALSFLPGPGISAFPIVAVVVLGSGALGFLSISNSAVVALGRDWTAAITVLVPAMLVVGLSERRELSRSGFSLAAIYSSVLLLVSIPHFVATRRLLTRSLREDDAAAR